MRSRSLLGELVSTEPSLREIVLIAVFRCARCRATWRVLPGFIARWLHRSWRVFREALRARPGVHAPARTRRRWRARLRQSALFPVQLFALSLAAALRSLAQRVGLRASRQQLLDAFSTEVEGCPFVVLAELLHRLRPGIRLA